MSVDTLPLRREKENRLTVRRLVDWCDDEDLKWSEVKWSEVKLLNGDADNRPKFYFNPAFAGVLRHPRLAGGGALNAPTS